MKLSLGWLVWLFSSFALGGNEGGNGGGGVVCRDEQGNETIELLDFYETSKLAPEIVLSLSSLPGTEIERVGRVLDRLARVDETRSKEYRRQLAGFFDNVRFVKDVLLPDTNDFGYVPLAKNCRIAQIAIQRPSPFPEYRLYTINEDLYTRLSIDHRAGLILHEIVYREALGLGHKNSIPTRYFTSFLSSQRLEKISRPDYEALMHRIGMVAPAASFLPLWNYRRLELGKRTEGMEFRFSVSDKVRDTQGGRVIVSAISLPRWMKLDRWGFLKGTPIGVGKYEGELEAVTSLGRRERTRFFGEVVAAPDGPRWTSSSLALPGSFASQFYIIDLRPFVIAPDALVLSFSKVSGPDWLTMDKNGSLMGNPTSAHLGQNRVELEVIDSFGRKDRASFELAVYKKF